MRCLECSQKSTIQFTEIAWHWTIVFSLNISCSLNISFFFCLIFLTKFSDIYIFSAGINPTIYLTLSYGQAFSLVSSSLCFLHIFKHCFQFDFNSTELHCYHFSHCHKPWKKQKIFHLQNLFKQMSRSFKKEKKNYNQVFCCCCCCSCDCFSLQYKAYLYR